jgi:hypothetical protein
VDRSFACVVHHRLNAAGALAQGRGTPGTVSNPNSKGEVPLYISIDFHAKQRIKSENKESLPDRRTSNCIVSSKIIFHSESLSALYLPFQNRSEAMHRSRESERSLSVFATRTHVNDGDYNLS